MSLRHAPWTEHADFAVGLRPVPLSAWLEGGGGDPARKDALMARRPALVWAEPDRLAAFARAWRTMPPAFRRCRISTSTSRSWGDFFAPRVKPAALTAPAPHPEA